MGERMEHPRFPLSGPVDNPSASDYATEAMKLRAFADRHERITDEPADWLREMAARFERVARMKGWARR